jgi:hypothetical protein
MVDYVLDEVLRLKVSLIVLSCDDPDITYQDVSLGERDLVVVDSPQKVLVRHGDGQPDAQASGWPIFANYPRP